MPESDNGFEKNEIVPESMVFACLRESLFPCELKEKRIESP